jgi:6-pyruvoyltetrahydropterin/6-carboxytetrahydropterin synthase
MYSIERYHDFSAGHRVHEHESKCAHLHGHNYRVHFVCEPEGENGLDPIGRVIDFGVVKELLCEWLERTWDHKMLLSTLDPLLSTVRDLDPYGVVAVPFNPTAENMARYLVEVIGPDKLRGTGVRLVSCRIEETRKCSATYTLKKK